MPPPIVDKAINVDGENASRFLVRLTAASSSLLEFHLFWRKMSICQNVASFRCEVDKLRVFPFDKSCTAARPCTYIVHKLCKFTNRS